MSNLSQRIKEMDDFTVVQALEHVNSTFLRGLESAPDELVSGLPATVSEQAEFKALLGALAQNEDALLPADVSVKVARDTLLLLAERQDFAPLVEDSVSSYKDNRAMAAEILSAGAAISMIVIAATTSIKFNGKNISGQKHAATPAVLNSITELVKAVASALTNAAPGAR